MMIVVVVVVNTQGAGAAATPGQHRRAALQEVRCQRR